MFDWGYGNIIPDWGYYDNIMFDSGYDNIMPDLEITTQQILNLVGLLDSD